MKNPILLKLLICIIGVLAVSSAKAQITALGQLSNGTLAVYCPSEQIKLKAAATNAVTYSWKRYSGITATGTATPVTGSTAIITDTPTDPGYYTYVSTGLNSDGCESVVSDPVLVYVLPGITASIASNNSVAQFCTNQVPTGLTLTATAGKLQTGITQDFAYTYQWYKGGDPITDATHATYTLTNAADGAVGTNIAYTVKINYVIKACTATTSSEIKFNVIALPDKPTVTIIQ